MIMILGTWPNTLESWCIPDLCQGVWVEVWGKNGKVGYKQENPGVGKAPGLDEFQNFVGCWSCLRMKKKKRMIGDLCLSLPWQLWSCLGLWDARVSGGMVTGVCSSATQRPEACSAG